MVNSDNFIVLNVSKFPKLVTSTFFTVIQQYPKYKRDEFLLSHFSKLDKENG